MSYPSISVPSGLQIKNSWTGAGICSFVHVVSIDKTFNVLFDCGSIEPSVLSASHVFCTHGHMDHIGACVAHARARALQAKKATYFIPECCKDGLLEQKAGAEKMDDHEIPMNIRICKPGEYIRLSKNFRIRVFGTEHRVPSQGYAVYYQPPSQLKEEFVGRSTEEMRDLARSGVVLKEPLDEVLQLVYTGDSSFRGLCTPENAFIFSAPILIMECTYLKPLPSSDESSDSNITGKSYSNRNCQSVSATVYAGLGDANTRGLEPTSSSSLSSSDSVESSSDYAKALEFGHVHLDDVLCNVHLFEQVQYLVFVHLSMKYQPYYRALEIFRHYLPQVLLSKSFCCLKALGSAYYLSKVGVSSSGGRSAGSSRTPSPSTPSARSKRREESLSDLTSEQEMEKRQVGYGWGSYKRTVRRGGTQGTDVSVKQAVSLLTLTSSSYSSSGTPPLPTVSAPTSTNAD